MEHYLLYLNNHMFELNHYRGKLNLIVYLLFLPIKLYVLQAAVDVEMSAQVDAHSSQTATQPAHTGYIHPSKRRRPGKPPTQISEHAARPCTTSGLRRRTYTWEEKLRVIQWLQDYTNYQLRMTGSPRVREGLHWIGNRHPPTNDKAKEYEYWDIDEMLIAKW
ncbi:hypothetical protein EJ02DRAFT_210595 [Clathrospora elynae]|uniref:Uncharacterized protein n=1 Tax=Clathrospora elynae TaxID=706981 RepID=A0A6A5SKI1_9PLEO|nr:hypothetical protein EJ02DRAFT_210595 [Clathrospora elynae]